MLWHFLSQFTTSNFYTKQTERARERQREEKNYRWTLPYDKFSFEKKNRHIHKDLYTQISLNSSRSAGRSRCFFCCCRCELRLAHFLFLFKSYFFFECEHSSQMRSFSSRSVTISEIALVFDTLFFWHFFSGVVIVKISKPIFRHRIIYSYTTHIFITALAAQSTSSRQIAHTVDKLKTGRERERDRER